jgi:RhtB (resistance to homoserine/threonine) family protein
MIAQFFTIGVLMLLAAMLPGPDFAMVTKNTISHSRRAGVFTTLGVSGSNLIHMTYCSLGLALVIAKSLIFFSIIKYLGAAYLIYLGISALFEKSSETTAFTDIEPKIKRSGQSDFTSFSQGFLCNLLNPKATLFFLALFTTVIKPETPSHVLIFLILEMLTIITLWFLSLTVILSLPKVSNLLNRAEKYIAKTLGIFLIAFGIALACFKNSR